MNGSTEPVPRLHILLDAGRLRGAALAESARLYGLGRPVALHLRARISAARLFAAAERLAGAAGSGWCVVNGRPDIALAAGAHAVQLGHTALSVREVRALARRASLRIGASVHGPDEAVAAAGDGADFLVVGTMYSTPTHPGREGRGPAGMARVARAVEAAGHAGLPLLGIGGIDAGRIEPLVDAGAHGVVVRRAVWDQDDPAVAAASLADALAIAGR